jgi:hypothetical protein
MHVIEARIHTGLGLCRTTPSKALASNAISIVWVRSENIVAGTFEFSTFWIKDFTT